MCLMPERTRPDPVFIARRFWLLMATANCNSGVKSINHVAGRCALFNVKLHFYLPGAFYGMKIGPFLAEI